MPKFRTKGGHAFHRKNTWLPCIINGRVEEMTEEEYARTMRETWWADNITNAQWPVVLGQQGASKFERSRLKKKMVGWLMALGRIAYLNPGLFDQAMREARDLYARQVEEQHPLIVHVDGKHAGWYLMQRFEVDPVAEGLQPPDSP